MGNTQSKVIKPLYGTAIFHNSPQSTHNIRIYQEAELINEKEPSQEPLI